MVKEIEIKRIEHKDNKKTSTNRWSSETGDAIAASVFSTVSSVVHNQQDYWRECFLYASLYENLDNLIGGTSSPLFSTFGLETKTIRNTRGLTFNIVKSAIDTATAKISKNKPRAKFITTGANKAIQRKGENLTYYMDGVFNETKIYEKAPLVFRDACTFGTGCFKISTSYDDRIVIDRVIAPLEITIDYNDGRLGLDHLTEIHHRKVVNKQVLKARYPDRADDIENADCVVNNQGFIDDQVMVIESWKKPSVPGAKDGKHTVCINNVLLEEETYEKNYFPFVFIHWNPRTEGFFGSGLAEECAPIQFALNITLRMIQLGQEINCAPRWAVETGSLVNKSQFHQSSFIEYKPSARNPPIPLTAPGISADVYNWAENLVVKGLQLPGINIQSAMSRKPDGLNSGIAIRESQNIETERFSVQAKAYENMFINIAEIVVDLSSDLYEKKGSYKVKSKTPNGKFLKQIDWKDCKLKDSYFQITCFPVSSLPNTPEGRLAFITELAQAGYIQHNEAMQLLEMPDLENFLSLYNASADAVFNDLEAILDGEDREPDPAMDIPTAKRLVQAFYLRSKTMDDVDEESLERLRAYRDMLDAMLAMQQQQQQQLAQQMQPPEPQAVAGPRPQSDLVPQV